MARLRKQIAALESNRAQQAFAHITAAAAAQHELAHAAALQELAHAATKQQLAHATAARPTQDPLPLLLRAAEYKVTDTLPLLFAYRCMLMFILYYNNHTDLPANTPKEVHVGLLFEKHEALLQHGVDSGFISPALATLYAGSPADKLWFDLPFFKDPANGMGDQEADMSFFWPPPETSALWPPPERL
jgi:hypothetical protein